MEKELPSLSSKKKREDIDWKKNCSRKKKLNDMYKNTFKIEIEGHFGSFC